MKVNLKWQLILKAKNRGECLGFISKLKSSLFVFFLFFFCFFCLFVLFCVSVCVCVWGGGGGGGTNIYYFSIVQSLFSII